MLDSLWTDLRAAGRMLVAHPRWSATAIVCLAIAIGANTAAFTLVDALLLRPLPFDAPHELVMVALREPGQASTRPFSLREYRALVVASGETARLLARSHFPLSLVADDGARMAQAELVSGNYFETLRVRPFLGRFFDEGSDREAVDPVAVLSHRLWELRFDRDPAVVGRTVRMNGYPVVITGVAPPGFVGAMRLIKTDLWLPAAQYPGLAGSAEVMTAPAFGVMGRLLSDLTPGQAESRLTALLAAADESSREPPVVVVKAARGFGVPVGVEGVLLTLSRLIYGMMGLLMAVACANVAALVLARGAARTREIAVRLSLGGSRVRIARQLLAESLVLVAAGCMAGTLVALWLTQVLVAGLTTPFQHVNYAIAVRPDLRVLAYATCASAVATVLCGIAPVHLARRVDTVEVLREFSARGGSRRPHRTIDLLVLFQFSVSTALLMAAGALLHRYSDAQPMLGFRSAGLVAATLDASQLRLDRPPGTRLYQQAIERLTTLPGVTSVGLTGALPMAPGRTTVVASGDGSAGGESSDGVPAAEVVVSSHYFRTLGAAILLGRGLEETARADQVLVNESLARRLWPGRSPIGRSLRPEQTDVSPFEVIGVVPDFELKGHERVGQPTYYRPFPAVYRERMTLVLRAQREPSPLFAAVRSAIGEVNPDLSIVDLRTVDQLLAVRAAQWRMPATALTVAGLLGLLLSAIGLYGVMAYAVRQRARELGIRLALGARPVDVRLLVLRRGLALIAAGLTGGVLLTVALRLVLHSTLFGLRRADPAALGATCGVLTAAGLAALYLPARRASRLEPAQVLRNGPGADGPD